MLFWGGVILASGLLGILRFETDEGFRHLLDLRWVRQGHRLSWGRTAAAINVTNRVMIGVGTLLLIGAALRQLG